jgi:hypothetical protein
MIFKRVNSQHGISTCGRYAISRARSLGDWTYQAIRLGVPWRNEKAWDGSVSLCVERFADRDDAGRLAAWNAAVAACDKDAAERGDA